MSTKRIVSAAFTLLLLSTLSCDNGGPKLPVEPPFQGTVEGVVSADEATLSGVTVRLTGSQLRSVQTSAAGTFTFPDLSPGNYQVEIDGYPEHVEFATTAIPTTVQAGKAPAKVNFKGATKSDGAIGGTATMEGAGMERVTVSISGPETRSSTTDPQGAFGFDKLKRGVYTVTLSGFDPALHSFPTTQQTANVKNPNLVTVDFSGTLVPYPPEAPTGLNALETGSSTIVLTWTDASDAETRFEVERKEVSEKSNGLWSPAGTLAPNATTFGDTGLTPNTTYRYRVQACNETGCSNSPAEAEATTLDVPPAVPTGLGALATGPSTVDLNWTDESDNETRFGLERKRGVEGGWSQIGTPAPNTTAFGDTGLTPNTSFAYRIRACNDAGCSAYSNEVSAVTDEVAPQAPTNLEATATGSTTMALTWTDASGNETGFVVERKQGAGGTITQIGPFGVNTTGIVDTDLSPNTTYFYRVQACNAVGCSAPSTEANSTTWGVPPGAPAGVNAVATGSTTVELSWTDGSADETGFRIERKEGAAGAYGGVGTVPENTTSFADTGLSANTTYYYRVFAFNPSGDSPSSNVDDATTWAGISLNLTISNLYLTQSTQTLGGSVPLVADKDGYVRVFATASEANSALPSVRIRYYLGGSLAHTDVISAPGASVPTSVDESTLGASWNASVPASLIQPGLTILADVDPTNQVVESDEGDNSFPVGGSPLAMDVRTSSTFNVTFVPVRQSVNDLLGNVTAGNATQFMDVTMRLLPIAQANLVVHAEFVTNAPALLSDNSNGAWGTVLSEVQALRTIEEGTRYYYGVVKTTYTSGVAGMGYLGSPTAIGWDRLPSGSGVAAHEWGHNWRRYHAPGCGAGSPDPSYPYADGKIGIWGLDVGVEALKSPTTHYDFMSYCNPDWISDYSYEAILDYREAFGAYASQGEPEPSLLIWGRVERDRIILEPSFEVTTRPVLPEGSGEYRVEAFDRTGGSLLSLAFQPIPVPDSDAEEGHFAFAIPLRSLDLTRISGLRVSGGGRSPATRESRVGPEIVAAPEPEISPLGGSVVEMTWDADSFPMALVRNPATGEVISFARGGRISLPVASDEIEVIFSDGLKSSDRIRRAVR
ncbi:MAG: fibronectin type III domain-containing protein [Gemmatimonadota bacterium]